MGDHVTAQRLGHHIVRSTVHRRLLQGCLLYSIVKSSSVQHRRCGRVDANQPDVAHPFTADSLQKIDRRQKVAHALAQQRPPDVRVLLPSFFQAYATPYRGVPAVVLRLFTDLAGFQIFIGSTSKFCAKTYIDSF